MLAALLRREKRDSRASLAETKTAPAMVAPSTVVIAERLAWCVRGHVWWQMGACWSSVTRGRVVHTQSSDECAAFLAGARAPFTGRPLQHAGSCVHVLQ